MSMKFWPLSSAKKFVLVSVTTFILVILCVLFLDQPIALYVYHSDPIRSFIHMLLGVIKINSSSTDNEIPDLLMPMTLGVTLVSWIAYWLRAHRGIYDRHTYFFKMVGVTVPLAFMGKAITKFIFGRIDTPVWVSNPRIDISFHWFNGVDMYHGFPSGHMAVLTPLFIALWHFYPRLRLLWGTVLAGLGIALVLTYYHFVSDVIAGAYLGLLVYCLSLKRLIPDTVSCDEAIWPKRLARKGLE